ncbi:MAG: hypothetical protein MJ168_13370 [Clostridia bacterium]|nr:hypothetical protein [Clostridia bacterium]
MRIYNNYHKQINNCKLCGAPVTDYVGHKICYGCVYDEIYDAYSEGREVTNTMKSRARYKGIEITEIKAIVLEDRKGMKI